MTHEQKWQELAELYALGVLDGDDLTVFREHAAGGCSQCQQTLYETQTILGALPHTLTPLAPSPALKERLMAEIADQGPLGVPSGFSALVRPLSWGLAGAIAVAAAVFWLSGQNLKPEPSQAAKAGVHSTEHTRLLSEESVKMLAVESEDSSQTIYGKLVWNFRRCGGCLLLKNLLRIPPDKAFQLWGIDERQKPVSLGVFTADQNGNAHVDFHGLKNPENFTVFKITVEDHGGALAPTTQPLFQARV